MSFSNLPTISYSVLVKRKLCPDHRLTVHNSNYVFLMPQVMAVARITSELATIQAEPGRRPTPQTDESFAPTTAAINPLPEAAVRPVFPVRIGKPRRLIQRNVASGKNLGELLKRLGPAWQMVILYNAWAVPLLRLLDRCHAWQHSDAPFFWACKHRLSCIIRHTTAKLEDLNPWRIFERYASLGVFIKGWNRSHLATDNPLICTIGYRLAALIVLPFAFDDRIDESRFIVGIIRDVTLIGFP